MSLSDRLKLLLRSEFNALKNGSSDSYAQTLQELRSEQNQLIKEEDRLIARVKQLREEAEKWEQRASLAIRRREDELAKTALYESNQKMREIKELREQLREVQHYLNKIAQTISDLKGDPSPTPFSEKRSREERGHSSEGERRETPPHRPTQDARETREREYSGFHFGEDDAMGRESHGTFVTSSRPFSEFDRVAESMERNDAEWEAERQLFGGLSADPLLDPEKARFDEEFQKFEAQNASKEIDDELSRLKNLFKSS